jgi:hypothetical protein
MTETNPPFIQGLVLSEMFYAEAVRPILARHFPGLAYSAALIGPGSEVLGFDTPQSSDHDWGPRLMLFLGEADLVAYRQPIDQALRRELPHEIHGYPVDLAKAHHGETGREPTGDTADHSVEFNTVRSLFREAYNLDPEAELRAADWLALPEQFLRCATAGRVFHDGLGQLEPLRAKLRYYPHAVWLYLLSNQWQRIGQEEAFMGRCGQVGDELGSRLVAARLVRDLVRLCFLMERKYAPYIKWFGSAFQQLACAGTLTPLFTQALSADSWPAREKPLNAAYEYAASMHNALAITEPLPTEVSQFHTRPFRVIHAERFASAIRGAIRSAEVLALPAYLGSVDQFVDSTDVLDDSGRLAQLKQMYH